MYYFRDKDLKEIFTKYDIPVQRGTVEAVHSILYWVKDIDFDELVEYLKKRSEKDIYNEITAELENKPDWIFYLTEYGDYISELVAKADWWNRKKYLYPEDFFDILHRYRTTNHAEEFLKNNM